MRVHPAAFAIAITVASLAALHAEDAGPTSLKEIPDKPAPWKKKMWPSPDWRDQVIYFVMTDRFANGDPSNDLAGHNHKDSKNPHSAHGGDFIGLAKNLDYVKNLGCTAIWVTPILQNFHAYHGYATCNFLAIEPRLGGLRDFRAFVDAAHAKGIAVIVDIVVNHEADLIYFKDGNTNYREDGHDASFYAVSHPSDRKVLPLPVELQDLRLFHNNGDIDRWDDYDGKPCHTETGDFKGMDDFRTELPEVRDALTKIYRWWIAETDVDGFRIDTVKHVDGAFWQTFCPAIHSYAQSIGKKEFFLFGEYWHGEDQRVGRMTGTKGGGKFLFDGMLHFPLWNTIKEVFLQYKNTSRITERVNLGKNYQDDLINVTFFDNHDVPRFLHGMGPEGPARLKLALAFLMTARGIPCIYYGTEQGLSGGEDPENREDLFDRLDPSHELYRWTALLGKLRKELEPLRRGEFVQRAADGGGAGIYAFSRVTPRDEVLVVLNTSGEQKTGKIAIGSGVYVELTGTKEGLAGRGAGAEITLPGYGVRIYRRR